MIRAATVLFTSIALLLAVAPSAAMAADTRGGNTVTVAATEVIEDDLYAFGSNISIQGTVKGDVVACGGNVVIAGAVAGDVAAAGGTVSISGPVSGSVRVAGGLVTVNSVVGEDVLVGVGTLSLGPTASVGRDLLLGAGSATVGGRVGRNLSAGAGEMTLSGRVGGDVRGGIENLRLADGAIVEGNIVYISQNEPTLAAGARVRGRIDRTEPPPAPTRGFNIFGAAIAWLQTLVGLFVLGLVFGLLFPGFSRRANDTIAGSSWVSLGLGLAVLIGGPLIALLVFGIGLFVGGWWLGLFAMALYGIAVSLAIVVSGGFVGRWLLTRLGHAEPHPVLALLLGLAILLAVGAVPLIGWLIFFVAMLFGLGALTLTAIRDRRAALSPTTA